jgi:hypothetical protein
LDENFVYVAGFAGVKPDLATGVGDIELLLGWNKPTIQQFGGRNKFCLYNFI